MTRLIALLFLLIPVTAFAMKYSFDDTIRYRGESLEMVGKGTLKWLFFEAYDVALWAPNGDYSKDKLHVHEIAYDMNFSAEELVDETIEQINKIESFSTSTQNRWRRDLAQMDLFVAPGDRVRMITVPGKRVEFIKNDQLVGTVLDNEFSRVFSQIWLRADSDFPTLSRQLTGRN